MGLCTRLMRECADEDRHSQCATSFKNIQSLSYLPTRLIEVASTVDQDDPKYYRLLETAKSLMEALLRFA